MLKPSGLFHRWLDWKSNGRLRLNVVEKMFPHEEQIAAASRGDADIIDFGAPWVSATYPLYDWADLPGLFSAGELNEKNEELWILLDPRLKEIFNESLEELGLVYLFTVPWEGGGIIWSNKEARTLADIGGLKTRAAGYLQTRALELLGASPLSIPTEDVEIQIRRGTIDATVTGWNWALSRGLHEYIAYAIELPLVGSWHQPIFMNAETYNSLPADLKQVLDEVSTDMTAMAMEANRGQILMALQFAKMSDLEIVTLPPEDLAQAAELLKPMHDEWAESAEPYGNQILAVVEDVIANYKAFEPYPD